MSNSQSSSFAANTSSNSSTQWTQHKFKLSGSHLSRNLSPVPALQPPLSPAGSSADPSTTSQSANTQIPIRKSRNRTSEEDEITSQAAARFASCLAADHIAALYPDVDSPFVDAVDVVNRLLPFHIFQQPKEDLDFIMRGVDQKGKGKATGSDLFREVADTRFALQCTKRHKALEERFRCTRTKAGTRPAPDNQAYILAQLILEADRAETTAVSTELRNARIELDRIERERRLAAMPPRPYYRPPSTPHAQQYYSGYPYAFAQHYSQPPTASSNPSYPLSSTSSTTSPYAAGRSGGAIPVQLPVASLPSLHAIGIYPVPASSLPPADQAQPPAVLHASSANGSMLSLEINVALLQSAQMNGLAIVLNSLMSRQATVDPNPAAASAPGGYAVPGIRGPPANNSGGSAG